jgi:hypothetical protein
MVLIDDAHWADLATQEVLTFVGRRLDSERIAMFAAERDREPSLLSEERSFPRLVVAGLLPGRARTLLEAGAPEKLATGVIDALLGICAGNPLGLLELPNSLSAGQCRGEEPLPEPIEVAPSIKRAFAARAATIGAPAHRVLMLVAANGGIERALLDRIGLGSESIDTAIASGLVEEGVGTIAFCHPLMQAAERRMSERISRADVAAWMVKAATDPQHSRRAVGIAG